MNTLEPDGLLPISTFPVDVKSLGAKADWLATEHVRLFGDENDVTEFHRLVDAYEDKLQPSQMTVHDLALIRRALLTVIDDGKPLNQHKSIPSLPWALYPDNGPWDKPGERNIAHRLEFCDAVQKYLTDRIVPEAG